MVTQPHLPSITAERVRQLPPEALRVLKEADWSRAPNGDYLFHTTLTDEQVPIVIPALEQLFGVPCNGQASDKPRKRRSRRC